MAPGHTPRRALGAVATEQLQVVLGLETAQVRGAALPPTARRHLPLKMRILLMAAKVAVMLDSKSASCTPVLRKAPADGLFSQ